MLVARFNLFSHWKFGLEAQNAEKKNSLEQNWKTADWISSTSRCSWEPATESTKKLTTVYEHLSSVSNWLCNLLEQIFAKQHAFCDVSGSENIYQQLIFYNIPHSRFISWSCVNIDPLGICSCTQVIVCICKFYAHTSWDAVDNLAEVAVYFAMWLNESWWEFTSALFFSTFRTIKLLLLLKFCRLLCQCKAIFSATDANIWTVFVTQLWLKFVVCELFSHSVIGKQPLPKLKICRQGLCDVVSYCRSLVSHWHQFSGEGPWFPGQGFHPVALQVSTSVYGQVPKSGVGLRLSTQFKKEKANLYETFCSDIGQYWSALWRILSILLI